MSRPSKRFTSHGWAERLVPVALVVLLLALVGIIVFVLLFSLGVLS